MVSSAGWCALGTRAWSVLWTGIAWVPGLGQFCGLVCPGYQDLVSSAGWCALGTRAWSVLWAGVPRVPDTDQAFSDSGKRIF